MGDEEDTPCRTDAERGVAADGALTLHAPLDASLHTNGSPPVTQEHPKASATATTTAATPATTAVTAAAAGLVRAPAARVIR